VRLRLVTVAGDAEAEARLAGELSFRDDVELVLRCMDRVELLGALWGGTLHAVVCVGAPVWLDKQCGEEAARRGIRVIGVVEEAHQADRLAGLGADLIPAQASCDEIVDRCGPEWGPPVPIASSQPSKPMGRLVAVWGPKGAPGRTSIAIEVASLLAGNQPETLLIDADPYGGDVLQLLGVVEELPTIVWAARMAAKEELDAAHLALDLRRAGRDGPVFIPGLPRAELWAEISEFAWAQLLTVAKASFRFTVCDVGFCLEPEWTPYGEPGQGRNRIARSTVEEADQVIAVCRANPVGIKNFLWALDELRALTDVNDVLIVANRAGSDHAEVAEVLRRHIGKRPIAYVPEASHVFGKAIASGVPATTLEPGGDVSAAMRGIVAALGGKVLSRGLLTKLAGTR